jgi:hypothetical protein
MTTSAIAVQALPSDASAAFVDAIRPAADVVRSIGDDAERILQERSPRLLKVRADCAAEDVSTRARRSLSCFTMRDEGLYLFPSRMSTNEDPIGSERPLQLLHEISWHRIVANPASPTSTFNGSTCVPNNMSHSGNTAPKLALPSRGSVE